MSTASTFEQEMLALINEERTSRGLNPLKLETRLNDSAEDHSAWMLNTDTFSHTGSNGSSATERMQDAGFDFSGNWRSGENIAWQSERGAQGISDDVEQLHQSLMNSPGHRANILNPDYEYIGIGIEEGNYNGWDAVMVTQNFATTDGTVVLDNGAAPIPPVEEPLAEDPVVEEPDVTETEEPTDETPDTDVTETEEPADETPDTDVTETEEPADETPDTDVTETEEPAAETPDTDVTETEEPADETPDTDVTETEEPADETPDTDVTEAPADDCFDVEGFLAAIEDFVNDLLVLVDDFRLNDAPATETAEVEDDFMLTWDMCDDAPAETDVTLDMGADMQDDFFTFVSIDNACMMDFV
ncbi:CAP domain-containing protein [Ruegeria sp. MALMAid1280]|uniref:CAP domain-containing protein n=1 Tax=Ruegeria sp. MALMAid1280 TaxID=3411634 RepID=UPI003B9F75AD